jgi:hydrogenase maturation protein HypF
MKALSLHITGIVQGVGFRPFVYNLATSMGLAGWVYNSSEGVFCVAEGDPDTVASFPSAIRENAPPMAVIDEIIAEEIDPEDLDGFEIRESATVAGARTLISPDIATCEACVRELFDESDRRANYPFINCTNCGPRFTIIGDIPYDRPMTTMRDFPMCEECAAEYQDPSDRRFHAQPDACFVCGPRLYLNLPGREGEDAVPCSDSPRRGPAASQDAPRPARPSPPAKLATERPPLPPDAAWSPEAEAVPRPHRDRDAERSRSGELIAASAELLADGCILAVKGLGGFHVACDATNEAAVERLRERKNRRGKPLAIMVATIDEARAFCHVGDEEEVLLTGTVRPIVLLRLRDDVESPIADSVAGGLREMGVMLPYTPLHHLLLAETGDPLVMTSGNLSEEPITTHNAEALDRLSRIADGFLMHDRGIYSRYDDSVIRVVDGIIEPVRRARGYAPYPLPLPFTSDVDILAAGPEQKNTFTLVSGDQAFVSQHIGDMENAETLEHFEETIGLYERLFRVTPEIIAYDLHPEYLSTKYAHGVDLPKVGVQHHHAHIVSVTAEHGIEEPVIGVAFDGTGYGGDGTLWGGEILIADWEGFERVGHLAHVPLPGGIGAIRRPARMAVGTLFALDEAFLEHEGAQPLRSRLAPGEERLITQMVEKRINSPLTSSIGRLFDTVASLAGVRDDALYEGQAAIELEACADLAADGGYEFALREAPGAAQADAGTHFVIDPLPVLRSVLDDMRDGIPPGVVSARFHRAVIHCIVDSCRLSAEHTDTRRVALAGGVFMNRIVLGEAMSALSEAGFEPYTHEQLPMNDGAVSYGQAVVAWSRRHTI